MLEDAKLRGQKLLDEVSAPARALLLQVKLIVIAVIVMQGLTLLTCLALLVLLLGRTN